MTGFDYIVRWKILTSLRWKDRFYLVFIHSRICRQKESWNCFRTNVVKLIETLVTPPLPSTSHTNNCSSVSNSGQTRLRLSTSCSSNLGLSSSATVVTASTIDFNRETESVWQYLIHFLYWTSKLNSDERRRHRIKRPKGFETLSSQCRELRLMKTVNSSTVK